MNSLFHKHNSFIFAACLLFWVVPFVLLAQIGGDVGDNITISNPIQSTTFYDVVVKFANLITIVGTPFVVIFMVYAGFLFVSARGNDQQLTQAKTVLFWTVIGAILIIGAWALARVVVDFAQGL